MKKYSKLPDRRLKRLVAKKDDKPIDLRAVFRKEELFVETTFHRVVKAKFGRVVDINDFLQSGEIIEAGLAGLSKSVTIYRFCPVR